MAAQCGQEIQKELGSYEGLFPTFPPSSTSSSVYSPTLSPNQPPALPPRPGRPKDDAVTLTVKIGIGVGSLTGIFVGSEEAGRIEFMIAGEPIDQVAACEELADRGAKVECFFPLYL